MIRLFIFLSALFLSVQALASPEPWWPFLVLRSEHFEVIYRKDQLALAKRYAVAAEQAHELLFPIFKEGPKKTIIVLTDETDSSNGMATFLPYPVIYVYPVLPTTLDSLDDYGDWPLEMIVHEYTHILNMYPAHGFYVPLKWIFGSVVRPNAVLPKWYLEGLAVDMESRLTDHGRLRAADSQAAARVVMQSQQLHKESVAEMNEQDIATWPYGSRPYMFGGWWWNEVTREQGPGVIEAWNQDFSRRLPFLLNGPMQERTQRSADGLLASTVEKLDRQASAEITQIQSAKTNPSIRVAATPFDNGEQSVFAFSPSGNRFVYWVSQAKISTSDVPGSVVYLKERSHPGEPLAGLAPRRLFKERSSTSVRWLDENRFVFDQMDDHRPYVTYRDLFLYDVADGKIQRLTRGQRAQEASPSLKADKIAYIQNDGGRNHLMLLDMKTRESRALIHGGYSQRLSGPEFLNDDELLFALRVRSGREQIMVYNFKTKKVQVWEERLKSAHNARRTPKGVLVSNADTGVRNVYLANPAGAVEALSNTVSELPIADYDFQRGEIVASELTDMGRRLVSFPLATYAPPKLAPADIPPPPQPTTGKIKIHEESYQPIEYMLPRYWIPFLYFDEAGGIEFQGFTSNADPVGRNNYSLFATYDTITSKPSYGFNYVNSSLPVDIGASYSKIVSYLTASRRTVESQLAGLNLASYWPFGSRFTRWNLGGEWSDTEGAIAYRRMGPTAGVVFDRLQRPYFGWLGLHADVVQEQFLPGGGYLSYGRTSAHLSTNLQLGGGHHVLLQARGAFSPQLPYRDIIDLGDRSSGGNYLITLVNSEFLLRGYPSGTFVGREMLNANLEYAFPLVSTWGGWGTAPLFLKDIELAFFADALSVDGGGWEPSRGGYFATRMDHYFMGSGGELRINSTAAYHMPISVILGAYYGFNQRYNGGFMPFVGLGFSGLDPLQNKTP